MLQGGVNGLESLALELGLEPGPGRHEVVEQRIARAVIETGRGDAGIEPAELSQQGFVRQGEVDGGGGTPGGIGGRGDAVAGARFEIAGGQAAFHDVGPLALKPGPFGLEVDQLVAQPFNPAAHTLGIRLR